MKKSILILLSICGLAFLSACGNDHDDDNNGSSSNAPASLNGGNYDLAAQRGTGKLHFTSAAALELTEPGSTNVESGTFTAILNGNTYTVTVNLEGGRTGTITLTFDTGSNVGHFTLAITGEAPQNGIFSSDGQSTSGGETTGSTTGTTTAGSTSGTTSGNVGGPFGKSMVVTVTAGVSQGTSYTVLFNGQPDSGTFQIANTDRTGHYTYGTSGGTAILEMRYDQSSNGASSPDNDYLQIDLGMRSFIGVRKVGANSDSFSGTYTLQ